MRRTEGLPGTMVLGLLAAGAALSAAWLRFGLPLPHCTLKEWTGLPCATCGTTRMVQAIFSGDVATAFALNPFVFCSLALTTMWGSLSATSLALGLPLPTLHLGPRFRSWFVVALVAAVIANWIYLFARGI